MPKKSAIRRLITVLCFSFSLGALTLAMASCRCHGQTRQPNLNWQKQLQVLTEWKESLVIMPGQVSLLRFPYVGPFAFEQLRCNGRVMPYAVQEHQAVAYLAQSYFEKAPFACEFHFGDKDDSASATVFPVGSFSVSEYNYPSERLEVDQKRVVLAPEDQARVDNEREMMLKIYENGEKFFLFSDPFSVPLESKKTSIYGAKRIFNKQVETQHLGTDYRAKIGTKIFASNSGRVVFTGDLFYGGHTVVLDHGLGIFTSYSHLSEITTTVGERVTKESLLGLSGMTGRVSGPHLHWGVQVHGNWVDGDSLVEASKKNFPAIEQVSR